MNSDVPTSKARLSKNITLILENLLGCPLEGTLAAISVDTAALETFLASLPTDSLENYLTPQWVVLAAGKGTRIDATGRLSKTLDIMFGEQNMLQCSRRYLPGTRSDIVVINPEMASRIEKSESAAQLLGPDAVFCVQAEMNGTGGALQAALPLLRVSDAEWIGVAFGDEPFLEREIFAQTLLSHFISRADVTLCGKIPETVVDKGGLFFDAAGRLMGTKEWYDMTETEKQEMQERWHSGEVYTNTGITLIRKSTLLERMERLQPHANRKNELHHVDLIRHCYEDGLKTNAFIYHGEVLSGVNRWSNVLSGEAVLFDQTRELLARKGIRVDPAAQITLGREDIKIGTGCYLVGRVHLGEKVQIGDYCRLENVTLLGATTVSDAVGLERVSAKDTTFEANPLPETIAVPVRALATASTIRNCTFDAVNIGSGVQLSSVVARGTVIPADLTLSDRTLGVPPAQAPPSVPKLLFDEIVPPGYIPGVFNLGEKKELPDWENLRQHIQSHSTSELVPRAARTPQAQQVLCEAIKILLDMRRANGDYLIESLTSEEIWGSIFEMVTLYTGNLNPYRHDKLKARQTALALLPEFWNNDWLRRLKLVVTGNIVDYNSERVMKRLKANPGYFSEVLRAAVEAPFVIDCYEIFREKVIDATPQEILWMADNDGEVIFDIAFIQDLVECGHRITVVGKAENASNDVSLADLHEIVDYPQFRELRSAIGKGAVRLMSSGAKTIGTNLYHGTPEFFNALLEADFVISKGQGNFFTTPGWKKDTFYLLLSKGLTAEQSTGVVADRSLPIDGLILAYLPGGTDRVATLRELCSRHGF